MYTYRYGQPADLVWLDQAVVQANWESLSDEERASSSPWTVAALARRQLRELLGAPGCLTLVAQAGFQPVGFLLGAVGPDTTTGEPHGHILMTWVDPLHRRRGIAKAMKQIAEQTFAQLGLRKVKIWTGLHNQAAVRLAEETGYVPEGLIGMKQL